MGGMKSLKPIPGIPESGGGRFAKHKGTRHPNAVVLDQRIAAFEKAEKSAKYLMKRPGSEKK